MNYPLGTVKRNIHRADRGAVEQLGLYGVATVHEAMGRLGLMHTVMRPIYTCLLYTSPSPRDRTRSRMPSSA